MTNDMPSRLQSLDLLRGLSVIAMILVITPGDWALRYAWLNHANWEGFVFVDMIFPTFLFCVGFSIALSISERTAANDNRVLQHIATRTLILIGIGLFTNAFPTFDWANTRIPGVLQRIALCWGISALIYYSFYRVSLKSGIDLKVVLATTAFSIGLIYWLNLLA
ncbi:MAG: putative acyltransferase [Flavobacteriales bacterium]|jgi:predicted acyltransferase